MVSNSTWPRCDGMLTLRGNLLLRRLQREELGLLHKLVARLLLFPDAGASTSTGSILTVSGSALALRDCQKRFSQEWGLKTSVQAKASLSRTLAQGLPPSHLVLEARLGHVCQPMLGHSITDDHCGWGAAGRSILRGGLSSDVGDIKLSRVYGSVHRDSERSGCALTMPDTQS